jgi:hypothetical protein
MTTWVDGQYLTANDLNAEFASKVDAANAVIVGPMTVAGVVDITNTTPSTAPTNGALVVVGGVGVGGALNVGGNIGVGTELTFPDGTTQSSAASINGEYLLTTTGGTTVLTTAQAACAIYKISGALTSAAILVVPAVPHNFVVQNLTTGSFSLTVETAGGASAGVLQGTAGTLFSDSTGVYATSAASGIGFSAIFHDPTGIQLGAAHLGALVIQSPAGNTTILPPAASYPAGKGVTIQAGYPFGDSNVASSPADGIPFSLTLYPNDTYFLYSGGANEWFIGWYSNNISPTFTGTVTTGGVVIKGSGNGITFPDGSHQTTGGGTTAPVSTWYTVGATDTIGSFAAGDTALRTSGFSAPFVDLIRNGLTCTRGQHYTLNADGIHINWIDNDAFTVNDQFEVKTKVVYSPSTVYAPAMAPLAPAVAATFIAYPHVQGFAFLILNGAWLAQGTDFTDDNTGFYLVGFSVGANDQFAAFALSPVTIANMLPASNPSILAGALTFADGTQQASAGAGRNRIINGDCRVQQYNASTYANSGVKQYGPFDRWFSNNGGGGGGVIAQGVGIIIYGGVTYPAADYWVGTVPTFSPASSLGWVPFNQNIEGSNCFDLLGKPVTASFLFSGNVNGTYSVSLQDATNTQYCVETFNYTNAPNAQRVAVTFPALPTNLVVPNSTAGGLTFRIAQYSQYPVNVASVVGAWASGAAWCASTSTNWTTAVNNAIQITNVQLEAGTVATPFERLEYGESLRRCQRYYYTSYLPGQAPGLANAGPSFNTSSIGAGLYTTLISMAYPVMMRVTPTVTPYSPKTGASGMYYQSNNSADALASITASLPGSVTLSSQGNSPAVGNGLQVNFTASAEL